MQILNFKSKLWSLLGLLLIGGIAFTGCKDDDEEPVTVTPVEDGFYVVGDASAFSSPSINGTFSVARNEVRNGDYNSGAIEENDRATLMETYAALTAGGGFTISQVAGSATTAWGANMTTIAGGSEADGPQVDFQRGDLVSGGAAITVPADGLYHIALDTEVGVIVVIPITSYGLIGAATPGGWSSDTPLMPTGFSTSGMTFEATEVAMTVADFKFRASGGWKVILDADYDNGAGIDPGIKINTNLGTSVAMLVPGGDNIANTSNGFHTATMTWAPGAGWSATITKTSDFPFNDLSSTNLGLIGAGLTVNGMAYNWDEGEDYLPSTPTLSGDVFTWTYSNVEVNTAGGGFKVREDGSWALLNFGYTAVTMLGSAAGDFETNGDGNFIPLVDGAVYNFTLTIDGVTDLKTFTAEPA